ncbi:unnamed protein product [Durusdinium trenchii]|uniref:Uncharacterized protein n=1 Tax=Durusdinium trenchii TaxID=1381693 RepID=A0ABP0S8K3_9DINO
MGPELQAALKGFREDLRAFFKAQEQHHVTRQRLEDLYLRLLLQPTASPQPVASAPPPAAKPLAPAARNPAAAAPAPTVGIAGVGKGEDSPDSKGAKAKRQAISLQELGGEAAIWSLVAEHLAELRKNMQVPPAARSVPFTASWRRSSVACAVFRACDAAAGVRESSEVLPSFWGGGRGFYERWGYRQMTDGWSKTV